MPATTATALSALLMAAGGLVTSAFDGPVFENMNPPPKVSEIIEETPEPEASPTPAPAPAPQPAATVAPEPKPQQPSRLSRVLACIRRYESSGNYRAVNPTGKYRNAYQMDTDFWLTYGGDPAYAGRHEQAPPWMQDQVATRGYRARGLQPWPTPSRRC